MSGIMASLDYDALMGLREKTREEFQLAKPGDTTHDVKLIIYRLISNRLKEVKKPKKSTRPSASLPMNNPGGIDMNAINVDRQGAGVNITFDPVALQDMLDAGITGFTPVIINLVPLPSILPLLGLAPQREEEFEVSSLN